MLSAEPLNWYKITQKTRAWSILVNHFVIIPARPNNFEPYKIVNDSLNYVNAYLRPDGLVRSPGSLFFGIILALLNKPGQISSCEQAASTNSPKPELFYVGISSVYSLQQLNFGTINVNCKLVVARGMLA